MRWWSSTAGFKFLRSLRLLAPRVQASRRRPSTPDRASPSPKMCCPARKAQAHKHVTGKHNSLQVLMGAPAQAHVSACGGARQWAPFTGCLPPPSMTTLPFAALLWKPGGELIEFAAASGRDGRIGERLIQIHTQTQTDTHACLSYATNLQQ